MARRPAGTVFDDPLARTASIPLALWICAAVVAHYVGGVSTAKVADVVHDRDELKAAVRFARQGLHTPDTEFQLMTDDAVPTPAATPVTPKDDVASDAKPEGSADPDAVS